MSQASDLRSLGVWSLAVTLFFCVNEGRADGAVTVTHPPGGGSSTLIIDDGGIGELNPPPYIAVPSADGLTSTSSAFVDTSTGIMKGFASFELSADGTVVQTKSGPDDNPVYSDPLIGNTLAVTFGATNVSAEATIGGAVGATGSVILELDLHGSFLATQGNPLLQLLGTLDAGRTNPAAPLDFEIFRTAFHFYQTAVELGVLLNDFESLARAGFSAEAPYMGGSRMILSEDISDLHAMLRLEFDVMAGDTLAVSAGLSGIAAPEFDPNDADVGSEYDVDGVVLFPEITFDDGMTPVFASAGEVDFSNTGVFRIFTSGDITLLGSGADDVALLENIAAPVPLPAGVWLFLSGAIALVMNRRRAR